MRVAPFKVGPDFIDPGHHTRITGTVSRNLDGWMLDRAYNLDNFKKRTTGVDLSIVEGVMGLYDGYDGRSEAGSTAQMAKWLDLPVVLVVNAQSMARSGAALVSGFERFDPDLSFAGVIFNKLGSPRHLNYLTEALEGHVDMPCLGGIPRNEEIAIPERHLGLYTDDDHALSAEAVERLGRLIEEHVDTALLMKSVTGSGDGDGGGNREEDREEAQGQGLEKGRDEGENAPVPEILSERGSADLAPVDASGAGEEGAVKGRVPVRVGIARDKAFCFYYQDNLDLLEECGAELVYFSPIADKKLPENLDGIYLGGGYPELHAEQLSANESMLVEIREKSLGGMPIFGECGGFMYLCGGIVGKEGEKWPMTGCFPFTIRMLPRLRSLGYRELTLREDTLLGNKGALIRGHEFHYSEIDGKTDPVETVFHVTPRIGKKTTEEGYRVNRTLGGYLHLHFASNMEIPEHFTGICLKYREERNVGI